MHVRPLAPAALKTHGCLVRPTATPANHAHLHLHHRRRPAFITVSTDDPGRDRAFSTATRQYFSAGSNSTMASASTISTAKSFHDFKPNDSK